MVPVVLSGTSDIGIGIRNASLACFRGGPTGGQLRFVAISDCLMRGFFNPLRIYFSSFLSFASLCILSFTLPVVAW